MRSRVCAPKHVSYTFFFYLRTGLNKLIELFYSVTVKSRLTSNKILLYKDRHTTIFVSVTIVLC